MTEKKLKKRARGYANLIKCLLPDFLSISGHRRRKKKKELKSTYGGKPLASNNLVDRKNSETLFVLANGQSINEIDASKAHLIESKDSIGVNRWIHHRIIPTFYSLELSKRDHSKNREIRQKLEDKWLDYKNVTFIVKRRPPIGDDADKILARLFENGNAFWADPKPISSPHKDTYRSLLKVISFLGLIDKSNSFFFNTAASIVWCTGLGLKAGYKEIVLCGADLHGSYFFEDSILQQSIDYNEHKLDALSSHTAQKIHKTQDSARVSGGLPVSDVLDVVDQELLKPRGIRLYISSTNSLLYPRIPLYTW